MQIFQMFSPCRKNTTQFSQYVERKPLRHSQFLWLYARLQSVPKWWEPVTDTLLDRSFRTLGTGCWTAPNGGLTMFWPVGLLFGLFLKSDVWRPGIALSFLLLGQNCRGWLMAPLKVPPPCGKGNLGLKLPGGGIGGNLKKGGLFLKLKNLPSRIICAVKQKQKYLFQHP